MEGIKKILKNYWHMFEKLNEMVKQAERQIDTNDKRISNLERKINGLKKDIEEDYKNIIK